LQIKYNTDLGNVSSKGEATLEICSDVTKSYRPM